jgi:Protein kinase domain
MTPRMAQLLQPKQQIAGYEIDELVGKGGMGEVYRARQISMDRVVALKILAPRLAKQDPIFAKRFVDEARAAGRLNHPNIIAVHDVGKTALPGAPASEPPLEYFSMEFVDGESVKEVIDRQGAVPLSIVAQVMQGMSEALVYAESQNMVHRDIKPDNIMMTNSGIAKLADLGLAMQVGGEEVVAEKDAQGRGKVMGTPLYMSPEQARALPVDARSDQYSLGATLFHMLTGKQPFKGDNSKLIMRAHVFEPVPDPKEAHADVPEQWRQLCMKLMAKNPEERFTNALAMRAAVLAAVQGNPLPGTSRRSRAATGTFAKDAVDTLPPWARYLMYGFAASLVLIVAVAYFIPRGNKTETAPAIKPVPLPDPAVVAQQLLEKVRKQIAELPDNPEQALEQLTALSQDSTIPAGPVREAIEKEISLQNSILADRQRKEQEIKDAEQAQLRQAKTIELEQALAANDLSRVKACLDFLTAERERLTPAMRDRLSVIQPQFVFKLAGMEQRFINEINSADSWDDLQALKQQIAASPLAEETIAKLSHTLDQRAQPLKPKQAEKPVEKPVETAPTAQEEAQLQAFALKLDALRGGLRYGEIAQLAQNESAAFENPEHKELLLHIERAADFAKKAEGAIRAYVTEEKPQISIVYQNQPTLVQLVSFDQHVGFIVPGGNNTVIKQERTALELPLEELVDKATSGANEISAPTKAVWSGCLMWMWRHAQTDVVLEKVGKAKVVQALKKLEVSRPAPTAPAIVTKPVEKAAEAKEAKTVTFVYGDEKKPWVLEDFRGENLKASPTALSWITNKIVTDVSDENTVPTVQSTKEFLPPFSMHAQLTMQPNTNLVMIGIMSGPYRARIGISNARKTHFAAAIMTQPTGKGIKVDGQKTGDFPAGTTVQIDIQVDADYRTSVKLNNQLFATYDIPRKGGTITPIIQAYQQSGSMAAVINKMHLSGTLVTASPDQKK